MSTILDRLGEVDLDQLLKAAITAAKAAASQNWSDLKEFVKKAAKGLLNTGVMVAKLLAAGKITPEEAKQLAEEEKTVARIQLRSVVGVGVVIAQRVVNAILGVLRDAFNGVVGFAVI